VRVSSDRPQNRSLTWWPIGGAAAIAVVAILVVVLVGSGGDNRTGARTAKGGSLVCPGTYEQHPRSEGDNLKGWVPIQATGVDGGSSLVPPDKGSDSAPRHVSLCAYDAAAADPSRTVEVKLSGSRTLTSGAAALAKQLSAAPAAPTSAGECTTPRAPGTDYLIGLVYSTGKIWVSVPADTCLVISNGQYATSEDLRAKVRTAYATRSWS
jgi:hypothetical protein